MKFLRLRVLSILERLDYLQPILFDLISWTAKPRCDFRCAYDFADNIVQVSHYLGSVTLEVEA